MSQDTINNHAAFISAVADQLDNTSPIGMSQHLTASFV